MGIEKIARAILWGVVTIVMVTPSLSFAASTVTFDGLAESSVAAGLVTCSGPDCTFCSLIQMVDKIIDWVVAFAVILAILILVYTGFKMVYSQGNSNEWAKAKEQLINIFIGMLLIVAAWTLVDTLMKLLVDDKITTQYGPWHEIKGSNCGTQFAPGETIDLSTIEIRADNPNQLALLDEEGIDGAIFDSSGNVTGGAELKIQSGTQPVQNVNACAAGAADRVTMSFMGKSVTVHRSLVKSLQYIDELWRDRGGNNFYRVDSIGSYNCRTIAGSKKLSAHAYGLAIDINASKNPHTFPPQGLVTNMPQAFVSLFTSNGWGWGGNWRSSKDAMHFSRMKGE